MGKQFHIHKWESNRQPAGYLTTQLTPWASGTNYKRARQFPNTYRMLLQEELINEWQTWPSLMCGCHQKQFKQLNVGVLCFADHHISIYSLQSIHFLDIRCKNLIDIALTSPLAACISQNKLVSFVLDLVTSWQAPVPFICKSHCHLIKILSVQCGLMEFTS